MGWSIENTLSNQRIIAVITLISITVLNIFGVRIVAIVNNTGVLFEILGMVVFAFILALFHNHQGVGVVFDTAGQTFTERAHPGARACPVPDVDRQRDEGEPRAEPGAECGEKEQAQAADSAEQVDLRPEQAVRYSVEHAEHGPGGG
jgi:hypothetical protein